MYGLSGGRQAVGRSLSSIVASACVAVESSEIGGRVPPAPSVELIFRFFHMVIPAGSAPVTHAHGAGFVYALDGKHVLMIDRMERALDPGQADWIPAQRQHTHAAAEGRASHYWFIQMGQAGARGAPPTVWPYPNARIVGESSGFRVASPGPHRLLLSELRLEHPSDAVGPLGLIGLAGVAVLAGRVTVGGEPFPASGALLQRPGDGRRFTNGGCGAARLLAIQLVPGT
jgi:hypothetical protein